MNKTSIILFKSLFLNVIISFFKILFGYIGASGALVASGFQSLSDMATDGLAIVASKLSRKKPTFKHPYGYGKIEYISGVIVGLVVFALSVSIITEAIFEKPMVPDKMVIIATLVTLIPKAVLAWYLIKEGTKMRRDIIITSGKESLADVLGSFVVLVSIIISQFSSYNENFIYADSIAMILVGILILKISYSILKENFSSLIGSQVTDKEYREDVKKIIINKEIYQIRNLIIMKSGPFYDLECELIMSQNDTLLEINKKLKNIENKLRDFDSKINKISLRPTLKKVDTEIKK